MCFGKARGVCRLFAAKLVAKRLRYAAPKLRDNHLPLCLDIPGTRTLRIEVLGTVRHTVRSNVTVSELGKWRRGTAGCAQGARGKPVTVSRSLLERVVPIYWQVLCVCRFELI